jgi:ABC-type bacteriocin/lantibiotic exporter with double-glycine peptidase domain
MNVAWFLAAALTGSVLQQASDSVDEDTSSAEVSNWRESKCCGPNSLYALLKLRGLDVSLAKTHSLAPAGSDGASLAALEAASRALGLPMVTVRIHEFDDFARFRFPIIAHLSGARAGHFIIVLGFDQNNSAVLVADALTCDIRWQEAALLQRDWSGYLLVSEQDLFWQRFESNAAIALTVGTVGLAVMAARCWRVRRAG